jgi:hypothetical protein
MAIISLGLRGIKMPDLIILAGNIYKHMTQHQDLFPNPPVPYQQLQQAIVALAEAQGEVSTRNFGKTVIRNAHAAEVKRILQVMASYVASISQGNHEIALKAGMTFRKKGERVKPVGEVRIKWVRPGDRSGELKLMVSRKRMHKAVEIEYTYDPNGSNNWQQHTVQTEKIMTVSGLKPLSYVWLRVRAGGSYNRHTLWSAPVGARVPG